MLIFHYPAQIHDAYIEIAEMLTMKDPMGAVDIYCRYPVPEKPTFDDAYIFGEIVRLIMKAEKFDDPRLGPNMICLGKIMGIGERSVFCVGLETTIWHKL